MRMVPGGHVMQSCPDRFRAGRADIVPLAVVVVIVCRAVLVGSRTGWRVRFAGLTLRGSRGRGGGGRRDPSLL